MHGDYGIDVWRVPQIETTDKAYTIYSTSIALLYKWMHVDWDLHAFINWIHLEI